MRRKVATRHQAGRLKQWLHYLRRRYPEAEETYQRVRTINAPDLLALTLFGEALDPQAPPEGGDEDDLVDAFTACEADDALDRSIDSDQRQDSDTLIAA